MATPKIFTDTQISGFSIESLKEKVYLEFVTDIEDAVVRCPAVEEQMPPLVAEFKAAVSELTRAMQRLETGVTKTDISAKAEARNKQQTAFKAWLRACQGLADAQKVAAATELIALCHKYDAHTGMGVDEQTGLLLTMISAIEDHYMSQIQLIGAEELFNLLKQANQEVCDIQAQRDEEQAYRVDNTVSHFRTLTDRAYRRLIKGINAAAYIVDAEPFEELIAFINSVIRRYKKDHLKQPTQNPTIPDGDLSEGGELLPPEGEEGDENEGDSGTTTPPATDPTNPPTTEPSNPGTGGGTDLTPDDETNDELTAATGITVKWTYNRAAVPEGSLLAKEMIVAPGTIIPASEWPEAHPGFHWNSTPEQMNDSVPYKRPGEWYYVREQPDEEE